MADLITLDEYKAYKEIDSDQHNDKLERIITSVSQMVKTYCANSFVDYVTTDKVELFSPEFSSKVVQLTESPIISITSVEERSAYNEAYSVLTEAAYEYFIDERTDCLYRTNETGFYEWATGPGAIRVTYKAGYATLPEDLKLAVFDMVTYYHKEEYKERRTIGTASMANVPSSTQWRNVGFPDHIKRVLDLYKHIEV